MNFCERTTPVAAVIIALLAVVVIDVYPQSRKLIKAPSPQPVIVKGYVRGHCVSLPNSNRVCKLLSEREDIFLIEKDGKRLGSWPTSAYLGETSDFEVLRGDLDGDGRLELIVSNHDTTSVGMGVNYWTIAILPDVEFRGFEPPLTFRVEEYGSLGTFVSDRTRVSILATKWLWTDDPAGKLGRGLYLVGQWWQYKAGQLLPLFSKSTLMRRYLLSFERERLETIDSPHAPYRWLTNRKTISMRRELEIAQVEDTQSGIIGSFSSVPDKDFVRRMMLTLLPENHAVIVCFYPSDAGKGEHGLRYIGDGVSGRLYPSHYLPSQPEAWLQGKRATVQTYREAGDAEPFQVLWIGGNRDVYLAPTPNQEMEKELTKIAATNKIPPGFSITYDDMHGLWGGETITVDGAGNVEARERDKAARDPKTTKRTISQKRLLDLIKLLVQLKAWEQQTPERQPRPDESRARFTIKSGDRNTQIWEWFNDMEKNRRLIQIKTRMEELVKK